MFLRYSFRPPASSRQLHHFGWLRWLACLLTGFALTGGFRVDALRQDLGELVLGLPIERTLAGGETHTYHLKLREGQFASVIIAQKGIDVAVKVFNPANQLAAEVDSPNGAQGPEHVTLLAETAGDYRIAVLALEKAAKPGVYEIKLLELRDATQADRDRLAAQQAALVGDRIFEQGTKEAFLTSAKKYEEALALYRTLNDREQEALMLYNLGFVQRALGEFPQALVYFQQALALQQGDGNRAALAATLSDLGEVYVYLGELPMAQQLFEQALPLRRASGDKNGEAIALNNLGVVARITGELEKARQYYEQALSLRRELKDRRGEAVTLHNLGVIYENLGDLLNAMEQYRQSVALLHALGDKHGEATSLKNLGDVYRQLGDWQKARAHYEQSLALKRAAGDKHGEAIALGQTGSAYRALGDFAKSLALQQAALRLAQEIGDKLTQAGILHNLGMLYHIQGNPTEALKHYEESLALCRAVGDKRHEADTLKGLAEVRREQGQLAEARTLIEQALELLELIRAAAGNDNDRAAFLATVVDFYEFQTDLLMQMHQAAPQAGHDRQALEISEQARARSLLETLHEARADLRQGVPAALLEREQSLQKRLSASLNQLSKALNSKATAAQKTAAEQQVKTLQSEYRQVQAEIKKASPRAAALTQPQPLSAVGIQQLLDDETLLLEYALGEKRSYLWLVSTQSIRAYELPPRTEIETAARQVYELLTARQLQASLNEKQRASHLAAAEAAFPAQAAALSQMLLGPVAAQLGKQRLAIIAAGALAYLPFAALPDPAASDQPLLARHEIINLPSASVLSVIRDETAGRQPATGTVAVLADPVFEANDPRVALARKSNAARRDHAAVKATPPPPVDGLTADWGRALRSFSTATTTGVPRRAGLSRLPFSHEEADVIAALAPAAQALKATGFQASRSLAIASDLGRYRLVHFATHGLLNAARPELSGLVFSLVDEAGQAQNGFLRLHEIYKLRLAAEVVVLSACQTALGKEVKGEGLIGLTRGFMYAGTPRVVASLWQVDDLATAELMKRFYAGMLKDGLRPAAALRAAQLALWKQKRRAAPFYWAAFVLQGEWQ